MKKLLAIALCSLPLALAPAVYAQTSTTGTGATGGATAPAATDNAGTSGTSDTVPLTSANSDWSVKDGIIGKTVYNENNDKVGDVTDVTISSDGKMTAFVVGAGGFLGMGEHNVAIPFSKITKNGDKLTLAGYTKDQLKAMPAYKSPKKARSTSGTTGTPAPAGTAGAPATPGTATNPGTTTAPATSTTK